MTDAALCPACGSRDVVPVIHGMPDDEAQAAARRGEVELGGCLVWPRKPDRHCRACGHEFGTVTERDWNMSSERDQDEERREAGRALALEFKFIKSHPYDLDRFVSTGALDPEADDEEDEENLAALQKLIDDGHESAAVFDDARQALEYIRLADAEADQDG